MDTQWPRYYVFEKPDEDRPFVHAGSVHGADPEMALLAARDLFGRRSQRTAMLLVLDSEIYARSAQEIASRPPSTGPDTDAPEHSFLVFGKPTHRGVCTLMGELRAQGHEPALARALTQLGQEAAVIWWLFKKSDAIFSEDTERALLFDSSPDKPYRHENHFPVRTMMMDLNKKRGKNSKEG